MARVAFVTGIAGFVGSRLAKVLLDDGWKVYGCDNLLTGNDKDIPEDVMWWLDDIREMDSYSLSPDVVFHTAAIARSAWPDELEVFDVNVNGTKHVLDTFPDARIVYSSSSMSGIPATNTYAFSKFRAEELVLDREGIALRYSNIYGPGQSLRGAEPNVLMAWKLQAKEQGWIRVDGDGDQVRDFIHVDDVVRANLRAAKSDIWGWVDICSGMSHKILDIAKWYDTPIMFAPRRKNDPLEIPQTHETAMDMFGFYTQYMFDEQSVRELIQ